MRTHASSAASAAPTRLAVPALAGAVALAVATALLTPSARAQVYGANTSVTQSDRLANGGFTNGPSGAFDGGEGFMGAAAMLDGSEPDWNGTGPWYRGLARTSALLSGAAVNPLAPLLRAEARLTGAHSDVASPSSVPITGAAFTQAGAVETYRYIGSVPTTLSLTYTLHADVFNQGAAAPNGSGIANVGLSAAVLGNVTGYSTHIGTQVSEMGAVYLTHNGHAAEGYITLSSTTGGFVTQMVTMPFDVVPGQEFSVVVRLSANAVGGTSYADAYSTAVGVFDQPDLLTSLAVPTPGAAGALLTAGVLASRRRRG